MYILTVVKVKFVSVAVMKHGVDVSRLICNAQESILAPAKLTVLLYVHFDTGLVQSRRSQN